MKKRTTMLMSALFAAGAFALNGNVAKADNVQAVNNNNANSTEVKQNTVNADSSKLNVASAQKTINSRQGVPDENPLQQERIEEKYSNSPVKGIVARNYDAAYPKSDPLSNIVKNENYWFGHGIENKDQIHFDKIDAQLADTKGKVDKYLDDTFNERKTQLSTDQNNAAKALIDTHVPNEILNVGYEMSPSDSQRLKMQGRNNEALESLYGAITYPYLGTLISARTNLSVSDYKNEADNYANKLAPFVAKNVGKDEQWVLKYTDPSVVRVYDIDDNGRNNGLPAYTMTKELLKIDYDAYNKNHGIKSDENASYNKNQSATDAKKDQSSEKVTNDTTSKKDQSTTSTSNTSSSNTNQTTESKSSTTSSKTTSDTKTPVTKNEGSNTKTTDVVKIENKAAENTASVIKNDAKAATEKTTDVKVIAPAKNASNEVKTASAAAKASDAHVVALNSKVNAGTTSTTPAAAAKGSQAKATENKLPQAGTDKKISLFASLAGLSIASLGLGALGAIKKRKND
jgi:hypothetical protein